MSKINLNHVKPIMQLNPLILKYDQNQRLLLCNKCHEVPAIWLHNLGHLMPYEVPLLE